MQLLYFHCYLMIKLIKPLQNDVPQLTTGESFKVCPCVRNAFPLARRIFPAPTDDDEAGEREKKKKRVDSSTELYSPLDRLRVDDLHDEAAPVVLRPLVLGLPGRLRGHRRARRR